MMWILIDVIDASRIERTRPADDAVNFIALREKKFGQVRSVLAGDAGDERFLYLYLVVKLVFTTLSG